MPPDRPGHRTPTAGHSILMHVTNSQGAKRSTATLSGTTSQAGTNLASHVSQFMIPKRTKHPATPVNSKRIDPSEFASRSYGLTPGSQSTAYWFLVVIHLMRPSPFQVTESIKAVRCSPGHRGSRSAAETGPGGGPVSDAHLKVRISKASRLSSSDTSCTHANAQHIGIAMEAVANAVSIAKLTNPSRVDWALGPAAVHQRFGEGDLASILAANLDPTLPATRRAGEDKSLTQGTARWAALGAARPSSTADLNGHNNSHPLEDKPSTATRTGPPPVGVPAAPPLPEDVHALLRRLRMPHARAAVRIGITRHIGKGRDPTTGHGPAAPSQGQGRHGSSSAQQRTPGLPTPGVLPLFSHGRRLA